jgi:DNA-binding IclR family transcriptional regulator
MATSDASAGLGDGVQVIARAAEILRLLETSPGGLSQAEMVERLDLPRTTIHRIIRALLAEGFVASMGTRGRYRIGVQIARMAEASRTALVLEVHPHLRALSEEVEETVDLSILERDHATFIDQVVASRRLRAVSVVGASFPLYCTANGKALLTTMTPTQIKALLPARLPAHTPRSTTSLSVLLKEIAAIGRGGVAFDREEHTPGICAVGAVVLGTPLGTAAVSIPLPATRFVGREGLLSAALLRTAEGIADAFGD